MNNIRSLIISESNWVFFWFESNAAWGPCPTKEHWLKIKANYESIGNNKLDPSKAKQAVYELDNFSKEALRPNFGFRMEHTGSETLADFAKKHNMEL
jgi:hypothetical protein